MINHVPPPHSHSSPQDYESLQRAQTRMELAGLVAAIAGVCGLLVSLTGLSWWTWTLIDSTSSVLFIAWLIVVVLLGAVVVFGVAIGEETLGLIMRLFSRYDWFCSLAKVNHIQAGEVRKLDEWRPKPASLILAHHFDEVASLHETEKMSSPQVAFVNTYLYNFSGFAAQVEKQSLEPSWLYKKLAEFKMVNNFETAYGLLEKFQIIDDHYNVLITDKLTQISYSKFHDPSNNIAKEFTRLLFELKETDVALLYKQQTKLTKLVECYNILLEP